MTARLDDPLLVVAAALLRLPLEIDLLTGAAGEIPAHITGNCISHRIVNPWYMFYP